MIELMIGEAAFAGALLCAAIMGMAIQRGTTCTVVAVEELWRTRRPSRLLAIVEASVWVGGGLLLAMELGWPLPIPDGYDLTRWTWIGAVLLGVGAIVNKGCVFGTVARIGSGEWAYLATPVGFYLGGATVAWVFAPPMPMNSSEPPAVLGAPSWIVWCLTAVLLVRLLHLLSKARVSVRGAWSPHAATTVIGMTFVGLLLLAGAWAYTDLLAEVVQGMAHSVLSRVLLGLALLAGAIVGGVMDSKPFGGLPSARATARCFAGGILMGWGSLLIPGGNDGLILLGMPLLRPYAWAAFATMCVAIALSLYLAQRFSAPRPLVS